MDGSVQLLPIPSANVNSLMHRDDNECTISEKKIDNNSSFFASFTDGSSFRNMIEFIRLVNIEGVFRFRKDSIIYEQSDNENNILNVITLRSYHLTEYEFSSKSEEIIVKVNLSDLRNITRNVGKKDQVDIYKLSEEPNSLYVRIRSQSEKGSDPQTYLISTSSTDYTIYRQPEYRRGKKDPTCTVYQTDFSKLCKSLVTIKCSHAMIHGFEHGIIFKGVLSSGNIGSVKEFGKCSSNQAVSVSSMKSVFNNNNNLKVKKSSAPPPRLKIGSGETEIFKIPINIIKYLIKLNALSPTGTLKIYVEKDLPLKLVCDIGGFGKISTYLMG